MFLRSNFEKLYFSVSKIFVVIVLKFTLHPIFKTKFTKKIKDRRKFLLWRPIYINFFDIKILTKVTHDLEICHKFLLISFKVRTLRVFKKYQGHFTSKIKYRFMSKKLILNLVVVPCFSAFLSVFQHISNFFSNYLASVVWNYFSS